MAQEPQHAQRLFKVMVFGTALSFGAVGAIIASMKDFVGGNAAFEFSYRTLIAFGLGCFLGWGFWRGVRWLMARHSNHNNRSGPV
jgi:NhaP-type Na+/H+ or K+/H+ antiporter